jgi:ATP-binding cassette subfamily B multidrug efflux pump
VQQFSFTNIDYFTTASLVTGLTNDVNNPQLAFMMALRLLLRAPMMLVIAFLLAYSINADRRESFLSVLHWFSIIMW